MDLNKVTLMGHIGIEPTYHQMNNGGELCKFSVATSRRWKDKNSGQRSEDTTWHNVVVFSPYLVDICKAWLQKGTKVYIEGEMKTRAYEKDGEKKYITEVIVPQIKGELFVIAKGKGWDVDEMPGSQRRFNSNSPGPQQAGNVARTATGQGEDYDDDIPF